MMEGLVQLANIDLMPGELYVAQEPSILRTILGSCISVTFFSSRLGVGAMCHGVLPRMPKIWPADSSLSEEHRYVDASIWYLTRLFDSLGARRPELEIKVFGGADVLDMTGADRSRPTVGGLNCMAAAEVLAEAGLSIIASDVGGTRGRKIQLNTGTGEVLVQRLTNVRPGPLLHRRKTK